MRELWGEYDRPVWKYLRHSAPYFVSSVFAELQMSVLHCSPLRPHGKIRRHFAEDFISVDNKRLRMTDVITWETLDSFSPHRFIAFSLLGHCVVKTLSFPCLIMPHCYSGSHLKSTVRKYSQSTSAATKQLPLESTVCIHLQRYWIRNYSNTPFFGTTICYYLHHLSNSIVAPKGGHVTELAIVLCAGLDVDFTELHMLSYSSAP